jgi:hypothetical protein
MVPAFLLSALLTLGLSAAAPAVAPARATTDTTAVGRVRLGDEQLLDEVQRRTFRYFWDFAHPVSGLARERSDVTSEHGDEVVTSGGSGFGVMAIVVATERGWVTRAQACERLLRITGFLARADRFHGAFPHWLDGATGRTFPFDVQDDGGDIVETAYLFEGLLTARQYFDRAEPGEAELRARVDSLWRAVDWSWYRNGRRPALWWNWSPRYGFAIDNRVSGWNEALVTYVLAAGSPTHPIDATTYHRGWARGGAMRNGRAYLGVTLPLGPAYGGPLFFEHFSFVGLDPRGLVDRYADYGAQAVAHTRINREHCVRNPHGFKGYGPDCWGLTSSDEPGGYGVHSPTEDVGVITPSAALSSFPFTPVESMQALRHFHDDLGERLFGEFGFVDAFDETRGWVARSHLAIDQGPILIMIENHRSGLPWRLFMGSPEVQRGLRTLGFTSPYLR